MRKLTIQKDGREIYTNGGWFRAAPPEGKEKQWVPSYSASELADYFLRYKGFLPPEIDFYLTEIGIASESFSSEPEYCTGLEREGFGGGKSRQHDLLIVSDINEVVIGLEAKAREDLDVFVTEKGDNPLTPNQEKRYAGLCEKILGQKIDSCINIRYQLLSATAGTLIEADKRQIKKAVLLILLFKTPVVTDEHVVSTKKDIDSFVSLLEKNNNGSYKCKNFKRDIDLYIKYLVVDMNSYN